ncbi:MAG: transglycosylase SLT domain-containing protein, partial [Gemmatimonas sp.]|nr:transglycosylase SLT domain-containing protein [Gemmatimonas sp.]
AAGGQGASQLDRGAIDDIPPDFGRLYVEAAGAFEIEWELVAAVGKIECDHGRGDCYRPNSAGAMGPMQFMPATWPVYRDASQRPPYDVYDARDAIFAAAAKLAADGIKRDPRAALFSYNHSSEYVDDVIGWAIRYGWTTPDAGALGQAVLSHPNIELRPEARLDIEAGRVDARVLGNLLFLASEHRLGSVGPFATGHSLYVAGTNTISHHAFGRAVDIPIVDGVAVSPSNESARAAARSLLSLEEPLRPDELGSPWDLAYPGAFTDSSHLNHLHVAHPESLD